MSGGGKKQTVGYKYFLGMHLGLCHGPIDGIVEIQVDRRIAWAGANVGGTIEVDAENLFGGDKREGGVSGNVTIAMGGIEQQPNAYLESILGPAIPAFRGVTCAIFEQAYMGNNPYLKPWAFKAQRIYEAQEGDWFVSLARIERGDDCEGCGAGSCESLKDQAMLSGLDTFAIFADNKNNGYLPAGNELAEDGSNGFSVVGAGGGSGVTSYQCDADAPASCPVDDEDCEHYNVWQSSDSGTHPVKVYSVTPTSPGTFMAGAVLKLQDDNDETDDFPVLSIYRQGEPSEGATWFWSGDLNSMYVQTIDYPAPGGFRTVVDIATGFNPPAQGQWFFAEFTLNTFGQSWAATLAYCQDGELVVQNASGSAIIEPEDRPWFSGAVIAIHNRNTIGWGQAWRLRAAWVKRGGGATSMLAGFETSNPLCDADPLCDGCCGDMNPSHIIRDCLTDRTWGLGYQTTDIDEDSFSAAALTLFEEDMGMSLLWDRQQSLEDFIGEVLRHIDGALYVSRETGKFVLKLIREEAPILTLDETNVSAVTDAHRPTIAELTNGVSVIYWNHETDEDAGITLHNEALLEQQGGEKATTIQYPGFTNRAVAARVALRDLKALSTPLLSATLIANREAAGLNVGDVFTFDWPDLNIAPVTMRVNEIDFGDGISNVITIDAVQDVFSTPDLSPRPATPEVWIDPTAALPDEATARVVTETPYYPLVIDQGETAANNLLTDDPDAGYLLVSGGRQKNELNATMHVDAGSGFVEGKTFDFHPYATLTYSIQETETQIYYENGKDIDLVEPGTIAQIDDELVRVDGFDQDSVGLFVTVGRGILDTVPAPHDSSDSNGSKIVFWGDFASSDDVQYQFGESIDVKMQTFEGGAALSLADAPTDTVLFNSRAIRPYPPGDFKIDGQSYPQDKEWTASHALTWAHRDRLQQTAGELFDHTAGDIGPESGVSYIVEAVAVLGDSLGEGDSGGVEREKFLDVDVGQDTSYTFDIDSGTFDSNYSELPANAYKVELTVKSVRDGYESWQSPRVVMTVPGAIDSVGPIDSVGVVDSIGDSIGDSTASDPSFDDVVFLLDADGANASTSFTDVSNDARTITANGNVQITTSTTPPSALFDGTGDYLQVAHSADLSFGNNDFCIEGEFTFDAFPGVAATLVSKWSGAGGARAWALWLIPAAGGFYEVRFVYSLNGTGSFTAGRVTSINSLGKYHIAVTRVAGNLRIFVDGVQQGTSIGVSSTIFAGTAPLLVGITNNVLPATLYAFEGKVTDKSLRITNGTGRYSANFTPPTPPLPTD